MANERHPHRPRAAAVAALTLAGVACSAASEPASEAALASSSAAATETGERWSIIEVRANQPLSFMREGGVLALSLLHGLEIELQGRSATFFIRGGQLGVGTLTPSEGGSRVAVDGQNADWLEGELGAEIGGERLLSNSWATYTLERAPAIDRRVRLCASAESNPPLGATFSSMTRRVACEPHEQELAPEGHAISVLP